MEIESIEKIGICLDQKNLFMTKILDITQQLYVKSSNVQVFFDDLLEKRGECMDRIDKCTALIDSTINSMSEDDAKIMKDIMNTGISEDYPEIASKVILVKEKFAEFAVENENLNVLFKTKYNQVLDKVNATRNKKKMFKM